MATLSETWSTTTLDYDRSKTTSLDLSSTYDFGRKAQNQNLENDVFAPLLKLIPVLQTNEESVLPDINHCSFSDHSLFASRFRALNIF